MFTILDYSIALEYSIIRRYTNIVYYYFYYIPKTQHRPIGIKINSVFRPRIVPFRRRYNLKKAYWLNNANAIAKGIPNITPTLESHDKFVNPVRRTFHVVSVHAMYSVGGLNDQTKEMYEYYQIRFTEDLFTENTVKL